jgi:hypothetical protein
MNSKMPQLIALLFDARNKAHYAHLQTTSYAQHIALGSYYESIVGLADSLVENHQGRYGIIQQYPTVNNPTDPILLITTVRSWIDANRAECSEFSEIQNIIDEVQSLNNSTLYKLNTLK